MTPVRKRAVLLCWLAGCLGIAGGLLLGIPGALLFEAAAPLARMFGAGPISGDRAWPAAVMLSLVGPFAVPLSYLMATRLASAPGARAGVTAGLAVVVNVILAALVMAACEGR